MGDHDKRNRFVVGIDFGTTFSGAAYLYVNPQEGPDYSNIRVINTWPGAGGGIDNRSLEKTPTEISFEDGQTRWGYEIPPGTARCALFKLLLDKRASKKAYNDPTQPEDVDEGELPLWPFDKTPQDVTCEYLKLLYAHVVQCLRELVPTTFDATPIHFVLTVPAIWSYAAQQTTCEAAKRAGFGTRDGDRITMVSEPEAAGAYCLREMHKGTGNDLEVGQSILICDAGGGTVDFVVYTVSEITPCLRVREAAESTGGRCGSTAIDRAFLRWLKPRAKAESKKKPVRSGPGSTLMRCFESAKRGFGTSEHIQTWQIPLGKVKDDTPNGIEDGELTLKNDRMAQFFEPIVQRIIDHAAQRVKSANEKDSENKVSKILLVGGFGDSKFLYKKLHDWCQSQDFPIDVIRPLDPWTAIVRGAVIQGIESLVDSRKLKENYGVMLSTIFDPTQYDIETAYLNPIFGLLMTSDHVEWFAKKGQEAENGQHFEVSGSSGFPDCIDRKFALKLVGSKTDVASPSFQRGNAYPVGRVEVDLSDVPESAFNTHIRRCRCHGETKILMADVSIVMSVASADLKFEAMFEGESYGSTRIEYHHDTDLPDLANLELGEEAPTNMA